MLISQLPEGIRKIAEERITDDSDELSEAFEWDFTPEGFEIWNQANDENFTPFYEFHNIKQA